LEFSAKTNTSDEWKAIISAISTLVEEAPLKQQKKASHLEEWIHHM